MDYEEDTLSKELSDEADEKWFAFPDVKLRVVLEKSFLKRYVEHCEKLGIDTVIFQIENQLAVDLKVTEVSYLVDEYGVFTKIVQMINKNGLCDCSDNIQFLFNK